MVVCGVLVSTLFCLFLPSSSSSSTPQFVLLIRVMRMRVISSHVLITLLQSRRPNSSVIESIFVSLADLQRIVQGHAPPHGQQNRELAHQNKQREQEQSQLNSIQAETAISTASLPSFPSPDLPFALQCTISLPLSPIHPINLDPHSRQMANIPTEAFSFAFAYPSCAGCSAAVITKGFPALAIVVI